MCAMSRVRASADEVADSICRGAAGLPRFSGLILRMGCDIPILFPVSPGLRCRSAFALPSRGSARAPGVIALDDTIERRWGPNIGARGIYRDPVRSSKGHFVKASGLRWLSAMLLVRVPWADRIMALPFLTMLAPSKRFYADKSRAPKTLLDWSRQAALQIHRWLPDRTIVLVADSAFAAIEFH